MEKLVKQLLEQGGVQTDESASPSTSQQEYDYLVSTLESWLGLPEATHDCESDQLMEDSAPFDEKFYHTLEELLIQAWKPESSSSTSTSQPALLLHSNPFLDLGCDPKETSLYKAMESVRITRLVRYWMELNVGGNNVMLDEQVTDGTNTPLSRCLLSNATLESTPAAQNRKVYRVIQALYYHVEQLPFLQSQLYFYTQSLMRGDRSSLPSGKPVTDAQSRLAQYKATQDISTKLNQQWEAHVDTLEHILGEWYAMGSADMRRQARAHLGSVWAQFVARSGGGGGSGVKTENTNSSGIRMALRVLHRILLGTSETLHKSYEHLLNYHLIPLHRPSSMVLWRDQTSLLELYHEPLVQCIAILLQKRPDWIPKVIASLMEPEVWTKAGNTPKLVLLLHEIDMYIGIIPSIGDNLEVLGDTWLALLRLLGECMAADHSRLAERALTFLKTKNFLALVEGNFEQSLRMLLPFLVKNEPSWNPTVRKMTYNVLKTLQDYDEQRFLKVAEGCFPSDVPVVGHNDQAGTDNPRKGTAKTESATNEQPVPVDFSLKSAMGGWKPPGATSIKGANGSSLMPPPSSGVPRPARKTPPLGVTGVAPWSVGSKTSTIPSIGMRAGGKNPPLGVTGVAPWSVPKVPSSVKRTAGEALSEVPKETPEEATTNGDDEQKPQSRVLAFMEQIKPPELEEGTSSWSKAQTAETPTILPNLKFHDLVFGHDLGSGAFGSVRYARLIDRSRTRSQWPEYAVKIISTEKIREMGYEASVQRELAVLRVLSHPGIARLISSFRFREGVYLVLEYASCGDLHSLLRKNGSLDHDSTRFVMGEVVAALSSIHDLGLVYSDLKPENIVITESGHVKLTDFGGCRPLTNEGKSLIESASKNLLKDLRDGDWKSKTRQKQNLFDMEEDETKEEKEEGGEEFDLEQDLRVEGTTAYLPPEVVMGGFPTMAADAWALGCVIYQCLSGRPPILEADESMTRNRIVSFEVKTGSTNDDEAKLFGDTHGAAIEPEAKKLIIQLLDRHATERPSMQQVAQQDFFSGSGTNVFALYSQSAHPLDVGDVTPVADAQWTRRQFSSIWAPQPQAYDISVQVTDRPHSSGDNGTPILEGPEGIAFFSKSSHPLDLKRISEGKLPPMPKSSIAEE
jgi:serine/threonine protein kinase